MFRPDSDTIKVKNHEMKFSAFLSDVDSTDLLLFVQGTIFSWLYLFYCSFILFFFNHKHIN